MKPYPFLTLNHFTVPWTRVATMTGSTRLNVDHVIHRLSISVLSYTVISLVSMAASFTRNWELRSIINSQTETRSALRVTRKVSSPRQLITTYRRPSTAPRLFRSGAHLRPVKTTWAGCNWRASFSRHNELHLWRARAHVPVGARGCW